MPRKRARPANPTALTIAQAIAWAIHLARERGEVPVGIVMGEDIASIFRRLNVGDWAAGRPELFNLPVEIDPSVEGWSLQVK